MRKYIGLLAAVLLFSGNFSAIAEEELFDTKAAASSLEKGIAYLKAQKYDSAITELEESVSIAPDAEAFYYLGYAYYMKGRSGDAESRKKSIENFEKAYELNPNFTPNRFKPAEPLPEKTAPRGAAIAVSSPTQTSADVSQPNPSLPEPGTPKQ